MWEDGWKDRYYTNKFGTSTDDIDFRELVVSKNFFAKSHKSLTSVSINWSVPDGKHMTQKDNVWTGYFNFRLKYLPSLMHNVFICEKWNISFHGLSLICKFFVLYPDKNEIEECHWMVYSIELLYFCLLQLIFLNIF